MVADPAAPAEVEVEVVLLLLLEHPAATNAEAARRTPATRALDRNSVPPAHGPPVWKGTMDNDLSVALIETNRFNQEV